MVDSKDDLTNPFWLSGTIDKMSHFNMLNMLQTICGLLGFNFVGFVTLYLFLRQVQHLFVKFILYKLYIYNVHV